MDGVVFKRIKINPGRMIKSIPGLLEKLPTAYSALRPKTLAVGFSPVMASLSLSRFINGKLNISLAIVTVLCVIFLQAAANLMNDYMDYLKGSDTKARLGPLRYTQSGLLSVEEIQLLIIATALISGLSGLYLVLNGGGLPIIFAGLFSVFGTLAYSAFRRPFGFTGGGELAALIYYGPLASTGTAYLQSGVTDPLFLIPGFSFGIYSLALLTVNNYRDSIEDESTGKITLAVLFGRRLSVVMYFSVVFAPIISLLLFAAIPGLSGWFLLPLLTLIPGIFSFRGFTRSGISRDLNRYLGITGLLSFLHAVLYTAAVFLSL